MNRTLWLLSSLLLACGLYAQTPCPQPQSFTLQVSDSLMCPGEQDTIIANGSSNANYAWYALKSSEWDLNNLNGTSAPIYIETAHSDTIFGLFQNLGVYKLDNGAWTSVTSFVPSGEIPLSLAISDPNNIYVATENSTSHRASVWRWTGTTWTAVGSQNFTTQYPEHLDLEIDHLERPVVVFANDSAFNYASVMRYSGSSWDVLGFIQASNEVASVLDLEISSNNIPHFAIASNTGTFPVKVYRFIGGSWTSLSSGVSTTFPEVIDLEFIGTTPYLTHDSYFGSQIFVHTYSGSSWSTLAPFSGSTTGYQPQLEVYNSDVILSYQNGGMKFSRLNGTSWSDYMVDLNNVSGYGQMKLGRLGFPVWSSGGGAHTYQGLPINTNPSDTFQVIDSLGLYLAVSYSSCGSYRRELKEIKTEQLPPYNFDFDNINCFGDTTGRAKIIYNTGNTTLGFQWITGNTTAEITGLSAGIYTVSISGNHCVFEDSIAITQGQQILNTITVSNESCTGEEDGSIAITTTGGTAPYIHSINSWITDTDTLRHLPGNTYQLITTDDDNCNRTDLVTVGVSSTISQPSINAGLEQTLCSDSVLLTTLGQSYGSSTWKKWFDLDWQFESGMGGNYASSTRSIRQQNNGDLIFQYNSHYIRRRSNGVNTDISVPGSSQGTLLDGTVDYVDGWLLYARFTGSGNNLTIYRRRDNDTYWEALPPLPYATATKWWINYEYRNGKLIVLLSAGNASDTVNFWQYNGSTNGWEELEPFGTGYYARPKMITAEDGTVYSVGSDGLGLITMKRYDDNGWTTLDSLIDSEHSLFDFILDTDGYPVLAYIEEGFEPTNQIEIDQPCIIQRWVNGAWQALGSIDSAGVNVKIRTSPDGQLYALLGTDHYHQLYCRINGEWVQISKDFYTSWDVDLWDFLVDANDKAHIYFSNSLQDYYTVTPELISQQDSAFVNTAGLYSYTGSDLGCGGVKDFQKVNYAPDVQIQVAQPISCRNSGDGILSAWVEPTTGTGALTYEWSTTSNQDSIFNLSGSTYTITVTDEDNCSIIDSIDLFEPDSLLIQQISTGAPSCSGSNDGYALASTSGGRTPYNFNWPTNWMNVPHDSVGLSSGNYVVFVNDSFGCIDSATFSVPTAASSVQVPIVGPNNPNLCFSDSVVLSASSNGNQFQWYEMKNGTFSVLGGANYRTFPSWRNAKTVDIETDSRGRVFVAVTPATNHTLFNNVYMYDGITWSKVGDDYSAGVSAFGSAGNYVAMELDTNDHPIVAYSASNTSLVMQWDGNNWNQLHTFPGSSSSGITAFDMHRDKLSGRILLAYKLANTTGVVVEELINGQFQATSYSPVGNFSGSWIDMESSLNGDLYILQGDNSFSNQVSKRLYHVNGTTVSQISVPEEGGMTLQSSVKINSLGIPYIHINSGIYKHLGNGDWTRLGNENYEFDQTRSVLAISPSDQVIYNYSSRTLIHNGSSWDTLIASNLSVVPTDIAFTPEGMPLILKQHGMNPRVLEFHPNPIVGAISSSYTVKKEASFWVTSTNGGCVKGSYKSVNKPTFIEVENSLIHCPGDSTPVSVAANGFGDSLSIIWSTGDTLPSIGLVPAGTYTVTTTGNECPNHIDTVTVEENPQIVLSTDSVAAVSCPGGQDGFISINVQSVSNYNYSWSDYSNYNSLVRDGFAPGTYTFSAVMNGCTNGESIDVVISEPSSISTPSFAGGQHQSLCENDSLQLTATYDTTTSLQWMSYDSISNHKMGGLLAGNWDMPIVEKNGTKYAFNRNVDNYPAIFQLEGERWVEIWSDTVKLQRHGDITLDSLGNFIVAYAAERLWYTNDTARLRIVRVGQDTSLITEIQGIHYFYQNIVTPELEWINQELFIGFVQSHTDMVSNSTQGIFRGYLWDGISLDTLPQLDLGSGEEVLDWGNMRRLHIEVDQDLWMTYRTINNRIRVVRYSNAAWTEEHFVYSGSSTNYQPVAMHQMPNGAIWSVLDFDYITEGYLILKYEQNQWDTINTRHPNMSNTNHKHDISHDPFGNPLFLEGETIYTLHDTGWTLTAENLPNMGKFARFVEHECSYPMIAWDESFKYLSINELIPSYPIGSGSSVFVNQSGVYQPVAEDGGCKNYQACPILVSPGFSVDAIVQQELLCNDENTGAIQVVAEQGYSGNLSYSWNTGDSTMLIDSLSAGLYSITVTDASGCASSDSIILTEPSAIQVQSVSVTNNDCGGNPTGAIQLSSMGGSGPLSIQWSNGATTFNLSGLVDTTYVASITDTNGCVLDSNIVITPNDTSVPTLNAQDITTYIGVNGEAVIQWMDVDPNINDNCGIQSITLSTDTFDCSLLGVNQTTILVADSSGNQSLDTFNVTVVDSTSPQLFTNTFSLYLDTNGEASLSVSDVDSATIDNCGIDSMYISQEQFTCTDLGTSTIWFYAKDESNNLDSVQVSFDVLDTIHPSVTPSFLVTYLDSFGNATIDTNQVTPLATDNCSLDSLWWTPNAFSCSPSIDSTTIFARDINGNITSLTVPVDVVDTIAPDVQVFQQVQVLLDANGMFVITPSLLDSASTDNCGIDSMYTNIDSVSCIDIGSLQVALFVEDTAGNVNQASVQVTISDQTVPTLITQNQTIYLDANGQASITANQLDNGSWDSCGIQSTSINQSNFDCNDIGANNIWFYATDVHSNTDSMQASVQVLDTIQPIAIVKSSDTLYLNANGTVVLTPSQLDLGSSDNCSGLAFSATQTTFNCSDAGSNSITVTVADAGGNSVNQQVNIVIIDSISPTITCPSNETICAGEYIFSNPITNDNCSTMVSQVSGPSTGDVLSVGLYTLEFEAIDNNSNSTTCSYEVEVLPIVDVNLGADTTISLGQSITLNGGSSNWNYVWSTGATSSSISLNPTADTSVWVEASNNYCDDSDTINIAVALNNRYPATASNGIQIYPNPTLGHVWVKFDVATSSNISIVIRTMDGRIVKHFKHGAADQVKLDLNDLAQGVYWIEVKADGEINRKGISIK